MILCRTPLLSKRVGGLRHSAALWMISKVRHASDNFFRDRDRETASYDLTHCWRLRFRETHSKISLRRKWRRTSKRKHAGNFTGCVGWQLGRWQLDGSHGSQAEAPRERACQAASAAPNSPPPQTEAVASAEEAELSDVGTSALRSPLALAEPLPR